MTRPRPPVRLTEKEWEEVADILVFALEPGCDCTGCLATAIVAKRILPKIGRRGNLAATRGVAAVRGKGKDG